jgi:hypothetical protein
VPALSPRASRAGKTLVRAVDSPRRGGRLRAQRRAGDRGLTPSELRTWPPAFAFVGPAADKAGALLFVWEMTGAAELIGDIDDAADELLDAWAKAREWWAAQERRR